MYSSVPLWWDVPKDETAGLWCDCCMAIILQSLSLFSVLQIAMYCLWVCDYWITWIGSKAFFFTELITGRMQMFQTRVVFKLWSADQTGSSKHMAWVRDTILNIFVNTGVILFKLCGNFYNFECWGLQAMLCYAIGSLPKSLITTVLDIYSAASLSTLR